MSLLLRSYLARNRHRKLLALFVTAGYPSVSATVPIAQQLVAGGADLLELGIPFSDPLADGPTIQQASSVALANGVTVAMVLEMARTVRGKCKVPIILMSYFNPIFQFGTERFVAAAQEAGVCGIIVPDLPVEESESVQESALKAGISLIYLVAPNTPVPRLELIDRFSSSFVCATSVTGVTGVRHDVAGLAAPFLPRLRQHLHHPVFVGFGVGTWEDTRRLQRFCDGVIVGSALVHCIGENFGKPGGDERLVRYVRELKSGLQEEADGS